MVTGEHATGLCRLYDADRSPLYGALCPWAFLTPEAPFRDVYARFPEDQTPWVFQFESALPGWAFPVAVVLLVMLFYPSIGFLNAIFARTRSIPHSFAAGTVTSLILAALFGGLLGWAPIAGEVSEEAKYPLKTLGNVVWTPDGMTQELSLIHI